MADFRRSGQSQGTGWPPGVPRAVVVINVGVT